MRPIVPLLIACVASVSLAAARMDALQQPAGASAAASRPSDVVETVIREAMARQHIPGLSVAVIARGRVVFSKGFGAADLENDVRVTPATRFRTASVAKPMTAVAALKAVEQGRLDLDAPVQRYCAAFPAKRSPSGEEWAVTTRALLSHRSGIGWYQGPEQQNAVRYPTLADAIRVFAERPLAFAPGTRFLYSSYGYTVVGCALEGATGQPYLAYMQRTIFEPAGMKSTVLDDPRAIVPHRTRGYEPSAAGARGVDPVTNSPMFDPSDRVPAGGLLSTPEDIARFAAAVMDGALVRRDTLEGMWTPVTEPGEGSGEAYGLGWAIYTVHGRRVVGHDGGQVGTSTALRMLPDAREAVAIMCNVEGAQLAEAAMAILGAYSSDAD